MARPADLGSPVDDKTAELQNLAQLHSQGAHGRGVRRGEGETAGNLAGGSEGVGQVEAYTRLAGSMTRSSSIPATGPGRPSSTSSGAMTSTACTTCSMSAAFDLPWPNWLRWGTRWSAWMVRGDARPRPSTGRVGGAARTIDASALAVEGVYDAAVCTFDGLNYLTPADLRSTFAALSFRVRPAGWLVFDVHTDAMMAFSLPTRRARRAG